MSSYHRLVITTPEAKAQFQSLVPLPDSKQGAINLANYINSLAGGVKSASLEFKVGAVKASLVGTFTGAPTADETITINGVAFTAKDSGATGDQFNIGANVTATAAALVAAINASSTAGIVGVVTASNVAGAVTVTCVVPGLVGNAIVVAESMSNFAWAGAATKLASGTDGTATTLSLGE